MLIVHSVGLSSDSLDVLGEIRSEMDSEDMTLTQDGQDNGLVGEWETEPSDASETITSAIRDCVETPSVFLPSQVNFL